jgi:hypothetical protein
VTNDATDGIARPSDPTTVPRPIEFASWRGLQPTTESSTMPLDLRSLLAGFVLATVGAATVGFAADPTMPAHDHHAMGGGTPLALLPVSTAHTFPELMANVDEVMHHGMASAQRNGNPDHDFASAMIPHHQGAVDMAKVELLYGRDPVLRRMAQEIIVSQQQEIAVMQRRIDTMHTPSATSSSLPPNPSSKAP